jgi:hypothetical protein
MCMRDRRRGPATSSIAVSTTVLTDGAYAVPRRVIAEGGYGSRFEPVKPEYPTEETTCRAVDARTRYAPAGDLNSGWRPTRMTFPSSSRR